ncbi:MAG: radical SAM protein [Candidatus Aminicenantes bacterium]|nr:radical SAM protein [Candidatus Aminicenantes bacterium]
MIAFGPVPSRRLGRSLGINNIPPKICSYACVYCQLGRTIKMQAHRRSFFRPEEILHDVRDKVEKSRRAGESIDYLTFVPDGEPTLDLGLERTIDLLRPLGIPIAVITNSSLLWDEEVRAALLKTDWVSLKADAAREEIWRKIDRPHGSLRLSAIRDGMRRFADAYAGRLVTETMLVAGVNDGATDLEETAEMIAQLSPSVAYLAVPTRPPAEAWVRPPKEETLNRAFHIIGGKVKNDDGSPAAEFLIGYEGNAFAFTGDVEQDLLSITAVHPMREDAVSEFLDRAGSDWEVIRRLVSEGTLVEAEYGGRRFFLRTLKPGGA